MRRVKSYNCEGNTKDWLIFNDKEHGLVVTDKDLRFIFLQDAYKYGQVFTLQLRKMIENQKPVDIVATLKYNCKTIEDLKEYILTVNHSNELYGFYDYNNNTWYCFKDDILYSETYVSDDLFTTKSEPVAIGMNKIIEVLKGYL